MLSRGGEGCIYRFAGGMAKGKACQEVSWMNKKSVCEKCLQMLLHAIIP